RLLWLACGNDGGADFLLRLSCGDLEPIAGFARLRGRAIDDEPLAGSEDADVVPTEQAVGADAVAPRNSVERFAFPHDVHQSASARRAMDRRSAYRRPALRADT